MSAEDDLRTILNAEAATLTPAGDGLSLIQRRIARRRRLRLIALPSTGVLALGVAATVLFAGGSGSDKLIQKPAPEAPASSATAAADDPYTGPSLLDFSAHDKDEVLRHWLAQVGIAGTADKHACESCDVVGISVGGLHVGDARFARSQNGAHTLYSLVSVAAAGMAVTAPTDATAIQSPTRVTGTLTAGVDESVLLRLVTTTGTQVSQTSAPAGSAVPWSGSLSWTDSAWSKGVIIASTSSSRDGAITRLAAVPVTRQMGAP